MSQSAVRLPADVSEDHVRREAVAYFALLASGSATPSDQDAAARWRSAHPAHERAWQRLERMRLALAGLPPRIAAPVLTAAARRRRAMLKSVLACAGTGALAYGAWRGLPWGIWGADYRTAKGGYQDVTLDDGTRVALDTDSAIDVRYSEMGREIRLLAGQILVTSGKDVAARSRPLLVSTRDGVARPLGTRFTVRQLDGGTRVAVYEGRVELAPARASDRLVVAAGESAVFDAGAVGTLRPADPAALAWRQGSLAVVDWRLGDLLAELGRYRAGYLGCDGAVADLRVSGTYPVLDTDQALAALVRAFPLRLSRFSRYWVTVEAA
ncbi:FecR domain-containing protein [Achromobacter aloeverae]|uniref:Iron dicitrate transport regulator FecR n=1 Tax=Achromobacter aloeverae TaxID=1750518 RepID=A0A4Q1HCX1_9BURK|nr:FecR domain-containing protein [Achromobacter aloeverae]RXN83731.1 iron dicitrate transport regulator FecR [Achromobacter aloeverae]